MKLPSWFERTSNAAVALSIAEFTLGTALTSGRGADVLAVAALVLRVLFGLEYLVRLVTAESRRRYALSVVGAIDLAAVVVDSGALKLVRILKVLVRNPELVRLWRAVVAVRRDLAVTATCALALLYGSSVVMWLVEREAQPEAFGSVPAAAWWAIVTLTTVGYGDVYPATPVGRIITGLVAFAGLGLVVVPAGIVALAITRAAVAPSGEDPVIPEEFDFQEGAEE